MVTWYPPVDGLMVGLTVIEDERVQCATRVSGSVTGLPKS